MRFCNTLEQQGMAPVRRSNHIVSVFFILAMLVMGSVSAWAEEVTFSMETKWTSQTQTISPITVEFSSASLQTGYVKVVKENAFTISTTGSYKITAISITATGTDYNTKDGAVSANVGSINHTAANLTTTWSGNAQIITVTNGATGGDWRISNITVTYSGTDGGKTVNDLTPITSNYTYTPTAAIPNNSLTDDGKVFGYGGNTYTAGMGVTVKNAQRYLAIQVAQGATVTVEGYCNGKTNERALYMGSTAGGCEYEQSGTITTGNTESISHTFDNDATVYISANGYDLYVKSITVSFNVPVTGITLNKTAIYIPNGGKETLIATISPDDATNKNVVWTSDPESIATVNSTTGEVNGITTTGGIATITARTEDGTHTAEATAYIYRYSFTGSSSDRVFKIGDNARVLSILTIFKDAIDPSLQKTDFTVSSSDESIVTAEVRDISSNSSGSPLVRLNVTPGSTAGNASLTVTYIGDNTNYNGKTSTIEITVNPATIEPTITRTPADSPIQLTIEGSIDITLSSNSGGAFSASVGDGTPLNVSVSDNILTITSTSTATKQYTVSVTQAANGEYSEGSMDITVQTVRKNMAAPTITCTDNIVTITPAIGGATIYYSTDGNEPTEDEEHKYSSPFEITQDCTIKAFATANDYNKSETATQNVIYVQHKDPTVVGKDDNSTEYNTDHSLVYELAIGKTRHIEFNNFSKKGQNWYNWILSVASSTEKATTSPDVMMLRADNWDDLNTSAENKNSQTASQYNWDTFQNDMDNSHVAMDVTNAGNHIYVNATIRTNGGTIYKYSAISNNHTYDIAHLCFTVNLSHITELNVGDQAQAYELTFAINEFGTVNYNAIQCGSVYIKNAQGLELRKGTYAPTGETVIYRAEANKEEDCVFYKWASGYKDSERELQVGTEKVNPCAVFLSKPGVTTPENIVSLTHTSNEVTLYYTTDGSDPRSSATRIEYTANNMAIRAGTTKVRAVAYIDGTYSAIQGTNVNYQPVTVLEARGSGVSAGGTFTGNTCTTNIKIENNDANNYTNPKSPNSLFPIDETIYRGQTDGNKITIGLNSTSAKKFVIGFVSNADSERSFTSLTADGENVTFTSNGQTNSSKTDVKRLVIIPTVEIEQSSVVTFTFNGNVNITYIEVFGTSEEQLEAPKIVPHEYNETNGWSYKILPIAETTLNYSVNGGDTQTSTTGDAVTINATDIEAGQVIKAWSTKDGMARSVKVSFTDASKISPVIRFTSAIATYNKANTSWVDGKEPTLQIYPASLLTSVTYASDDTNVGSATNGQEKITLGSGQGVATITASVIVAEDAPGLTAGTYTCKLTLTLADGFAQQLGANEVPGVQGKKYILDDSGNKILTLTFGGWDHGDPSNPYNWSASSSGGGTAGTDRWPAPKDDAYLTPIDGYKHNSQMVNDARDEIKEKVNWQSNTAANIYTKVNPFSMPCRGAYITVVPECNGKLTIYLVQNGCIDAKGAIVGDPYSRVYYWYDEDGDVIPPTSVTIKGKVTEGRRRSDYASTITTWLNNIQSETVKQKLENDINNGWPDMVGADKHPIPYCGGYFLPEKDYIKYVVQLVAGRTYYFFSNGSKMGYSGLNFAPSTDGRLTIVKPEGGEMIITTQESLALSQNTPFSAPSDMTTYKSVTLDRKFAADTWNTICLPFHVSEDRVKEYFGEGTQLIIYDGMEGQTATFKYHVHQDILAGQAYLIKPTKEIPANTLDFKNVTIKNGQTVYNNGSDGTDGTFTFVGTFGPTEIKAYDHYTNASGKITYFESGTSTMPGYRAYLKNNTVKESGGGAKAIVIKGISLFNAAKDIDDDDVTGIIEVIINDMHEIYQPTTGVYNMSGIKVGETTEGLPAGIYIMDGRKISIK